MRMVTNILILGVGATIAVDAWAVLRFALFGVPKPDYRLLGRWAGHWPNATFWHDAIARTPAIHHEQHLGWCVHYGIGIGFAALFTLIARPSWLVEPQLLPALSFGLITVLAPFLVMQPAWGLGIAGSRTPKPWQTRLQSVLTHLVFGFGLYASARSLMI